MKRKIALVTLAAALAFSTVACGSDTSGGSGESSGGSETSETTSNADKPLVWFNRQPSTALQASLI